MRTTIVLALTLLATPVLAQSVTLEEKDFQKVQELQKDSTIATKLLGSLEATKNDTENPQIEALGILVKPGTVAGDPIWVTRDDPLWAQIEPVFKQILEAKSTQAKSDMQQLGIVVNPTPVEIKAPPMEDQPSEEIAPGIPAPEPQAAPQTYSKTYKKRVPQ